MHPIEVVIHCFYTLARYKPPLTMKTAVKTWKPTKQQHLYLHKSGTYYARISIGGKKTWKSLKTNLLSVARVELDELLETIAVQSELSGRGQINDRITGSEAIAIRREQLTNDPSIKPSTRKYWNEVLDSLGRSWPRLLNSELRNITEDQCQRWAGTFRASMSANRYNNGVSALRKLFEIAIKRGARRTNPAMELKRVKAHSKDLSSRLPSPAKFMEWVTEIRRPNARFSEACADFVEFLAYTGVRVGEARWITWKDCDLDRGEILITGDPETATKNSEIRRVPMVPACRDLILRLRAARSDAIPTELVLQVNEAQKAMDRAGKVVGMERITHHDLRHLFATICIESGVDIPTVSKWLGHKDGGALAMKVYGHLRNEHSLAAAKTVSFGA